MGKFIKEIIEIVVVVILLFIGVQYLFFRDSQPTSGVNEEVYTVIDTIIVADTVTVVNVVDSVYVITVWDYKTLIDTVVVYSDSFSDSVAVGSAIIEKEDVYEIKLRTKFFYTGKKFQHDAPATGF